MDSTQRQAGFVLTDALAALFVLAATAAGFSSAFGLAAREGRLSATTGEALKLALQCLETENPSDSRITVTVAGVAYTQHRTLSPEKADAPRFVTLERIKCSILWSPQPGERRHLEMERLDVA